MSEKRSWRGMVVAVAKVRLKNDIRLLDLTDFRIPKSPFEIEYLCYHLQLIRLFQSFGLALSQPFLPGEEKSLYLPSQKLCELIHQRNLDGVIYPSAMGPGKNIVLINPEDGEPYEVKYVRVGTPAFSTTEISDHDDLYDEWPYQYLLEDINI